MAHGLNRQAFLPFISKFSGPVVVAAVAKARAEVVVAAPVKLGYGWRLAMLGGLKP